MFKLFKETFKTTNDGIILAVPLALFWLVLSFYANFSVQSINTIPKMVLAVVTILFMTSAFASGWFYMVKKAVKFSKKDFIFDKDKDSEAVRLIRAIPRGIGNFFLSFVQVSFLFIAFLILLGIIIKFATNPFVSEINSILNSYDIHVSSPEEMRVVLNNFSLDKLVEIFMNIMSPALKLLFIVVTIPTLFSFISMLWIPEIIYTKRNALISFFTSIKKVFVKFWKSVGLYIYIVILQGILSILSSYSLVNPFLYLVGMVVHFYFLVYVVVLIFSYYDREFRKTEKE